MWFDLTEDGEMNGPTEKHKKPPKQNGEGVAKGIGSWEVWSSAATVWPTVEAPQVDHPIVCKLHPVPPSRAVQKTCGINT